MNNEALEDDLQLPEIDGDYIIITEEGGRYQCNYCRENSHWKMLIESKITEIGYGRIIQIPPSNTREWIIDWERIPS